MANKDRAKKPARKKAAQNLKQKRQAKKEKRAAHEADRRLAP